MKRTNKNAQGDYRVERVSFCSTSTDDRQCIVIDGQTLRPNEDTAYVEFYLCHAFPVVNKWRTGVLPQVVANSYRTLQHKVFNLAHIMRNYDPKTHARDRILGTVVAVEFPTMPETGWPLDSKARAPGIRAVAAMHKAAENVMDILASWFTENDKAQEWSVSIENKLYVEDGGFLMKAEGGIKNEELKAFGDKTPANLFGLGLVYVPFADAPAGLQECLNQEADDEREGVTSTRVCRDYLQHETIFLMGGLEGSIRYCGVGLTPASGAREEEARVATMMASEAMVDLSGATAPFTAFGETLFGTRR